MEQTISKRLANVTPQQLYDLTLQANPIRPVDLLRPVLKSEVRCSPAESHARWAAKIVDPQRCEDQDPLDAPCSASTQRKQSAARGALGPRNV